MATSDHGSEPSGLLAGKYRLDERIAEGGMGEVYRGTNVSCDRAVAIKVLRHHALSNPDVVARFLREGRAANAVTHPNILGVIDLDQDGETLFMVQDFLDGEDLRSYLKTRTKLDVLEALDVMLPVASALAAAHAIGIVHRDIKPGNIFLRIDGDDLVPMVLDFGIAKMTDDGKELTTSDSSLGTPAYMSPEQITTPKLTDARSDVWALGVLLHKLISGKLPFRSETRGGMLVAVCTKPPIPLEQDAPGVDAELASVVSLCLQKDPNARPKHAGLVAEKLQTIRNRIAATGSRPAAAAEPARASDPSYGGPLDGLLSPPEAGKPQEPMAILPFAPLEPAVGLLEDERPRAPRSAPRPIDLSGPLEVDAGGDDGATAISNGPLLAHSAPPHASATNQSPRVFGSGLPSSTPPIHSSAPPAVVGIVSSPPPQRSQHPSRGPGAASSLRPSRPAYEPDEDERSEGEELMALAVGSAAALVAVWVGWSLRRPAGLELIGERWGPLPHLIGAAALAYGCVLVARYDRRSLAAWGAAVGLGLLAVASASASLGIWRAGLAAALFRFLQRFVPWLGALSLVALAVVAGLRGKEQHEDGNTRMVVAFGGAALLAVIAALRLLL